MRLQERRREERRVLHAQREAEQQSGGAGDRRARPREPSQREQQRADLERRRCRVDVARRRVVGQRRVREDARLPRTRRHERRRARGRARRRARRTRARSRSAVRGERDAVDRERGGVEAFCERRQVAVDVAARAAAAAPHATTRSPARSAGGTRARRRPRAVRAPRGTRPPAITPARPSGTSAIGSRPGRRRAARRTRLMSRRAAIRTATPSSASTHQRSACSRPSASGDVRDAPEADEHADRCAAYARRDLSVGVGRDASLRRVQASRDANAQAANATSSPSVRTISPARASAARRRRAVPASSAGALGSP